MVQLPRKMMTAPIREAKRELFLEAFKKTGIAGNAAKLVNVSTSTVNRWRQNDRAFEAAYNEALAEANGVIEKEAFRRAVEGWDEPVFQGGKQVLSPDGTPAIVHKYSDRLLEVLLRGRIQKYNNKVITEPPKPAEPEMRPELMDKMLKLVNAAEERGLIPPEKEVIEGDFRATPVDTSDNEVER